MDYILVENGEIVGYPRPLPQNWKDVSNFYVAGDDFVRSYGWFPVRVVPVTKGENDIVVGQRFEIHSNEVLQYEEIRTKFESEIQEENNAKWENIRMQRNRLLTESDWTQLSDISISSEKLNEWKIYRQKLRDITEFETPENIVWPIKPIVL